MNCCQHNRIGKIANMRKKLELADTDVVKRYLNAVNASMTAEEDFS